MAAIEKKLLVVSNPISGAGSSRDVLKAIDSKPESLEALRRLCKAESAEGWPRIVTDQAGQWKKLALDYLSTGRVAAVLAIGGDGTLMECAQVLHGLRDSARGLSAELVPALIPVPGGRGNDFVRALCGYRAEDGDFWSWAASRGRWTDQAIDLGSVNGRVFLNMASLGYGAQVVENVHRRKAFWSNTPAVYQVEGALAILASEPARVEVLVEERSQYRGGFFGAFVGNGRANGSGLFWAARAELADQKLDALIFSHPGVLGMARSLGRVKRGQPPAFRHEYLQGGQITFHFSSEVPLELDGDYIGRALRFDFRVLPRALRVWRVANPA